MVVRYSDMKIALAKDQGIVNVIENAMKPTVVPNGVLDPKPMNVVDTSKSFLVLNSLCVMKQKNSFLIIILFSCHSIKFQSQRK